MFGLLVLAMIGTILDQEAIHLARETQNKAIASGDIEQAASYWTEDVTLRRGFGTSTAGKENYRTLLTPFENSLVYERQPESIEVSPVWPLAFESGTWTARRKNDPTPIIIGRYSAQWVKRNQNWLIRSEVFVALECTENPTQWEVAP